MINTSELLHAWINRTKSDIEGGLFVLARKFHLKHHFKIPESPETEEAIAKFHSKKALNKTDLILFSYSVFQNKTIFQAFLQSLPPTVSRLMERLIWVESMTSDEVETFLQEPIILPPTRMYGSYELRNEFYIFDVKSRYLYFNSKPEYILSIPVFLKKVLVEYYPQPVHYNLLPLDKIPETTYRFTAENLILQEMPRLLSYYMQDGIKYTGSGRPTDATLGKLQRSCSITEFFTGDDELLGKIRSMLVAGLLYNFKVSNISIDTVSVLKELFVKRYSLLHTSQFILMHLKGWAYVRDDEYLKNAEQNFYQVLKQLSVDKWVSADNLIDFIQYRFIQVKPVDRYALNDRLYFEKEVKGMHGSYKEKKYAGINTNMLVYNPFIKGTIFLFASFGLIEIAYTDVNTEEYDKTFYAGYDGLLYLKLTALGAYVLGISDAYEPAQALQQNKLQFSEDSLMILVEGDMGVLDIMLASYAEKAGNNRFKVTHAHFLKDCRSIKDIDKKIALFKKTISANLPAYWELQFKIWLDNAVKINADHTTLVFKIPPDAKELQRLIAQDAVLKALILKAEQFHILVTINNVAKFKSRMKELGYLVE